MQHEGVVSITQISERDAALLEGAGFVREGEAWRVPVGCTVVRAQPRSDLVDIKVFYGDAQLCGISGTCIFIAPPHEREQNGAGVAHAAAVGPAPV
jgi:hypothetical protein